MPPDRRNLKLPALSPDQVECKRGSAYPEPFRSRVMSRVKQKLGDALGLTQFGVNLVTLEPGAMSALRHWHTREDEFVYVLSGELVLVTDGGEQILRAGDCAGYPAGKADAHHMFNRSKAPAQYLEVGSRFEDDYAFYPEDDLRWVHERVPRADGTSEAREIPVHKDGKPY